MDQSDERRGESVHERLQQRVQALRGLQEETEKRRQEAEQQGLNFTAPTPEQLEEKLRRARSPMVVWQSWGGSAPRGGTLSYDVGIMNPDPDPWVWLFAHVLVGRANLAANIDDAVTTVDSRFPQLTEPAFAGMQLGPGASSSLSFTIDIPSRADVSNYLGNSLLFQATWHDPAVYLDRGLFVFGVT